MMPRKPGDLVASGLREYRRSKPCPVDGKIVYLSQVDANGAARRLTQRGRQVRV